MTGRSYPTAHFALPRWAQRVLARVTGAGTGDPAELDRERGSLPMVMLVILVSITLSSLLVPTLIQQNGSTRTDIQRVRALNAAETGLQVALGQIRAAVSSSTGLGDVSKLPCSAITGAVTTANTERYSVTPSYFDTDPRGQNDAWKSANAITCGTNRNGVTPSYAALTAYGTNSATSNFHQSNDRRVDATYVILTNNQNIPGGLIQNYNSGAAGFVALCLDAGSAQPTDGTAVLAVACDYSVPDKQKFSYRNDQTIVLNSSVTLSTPLGMCVQADSTNTIVMKTCQPDTNSDGTANTNIYLQQWSFDDSAHFESTLNTSPKTVSNQCIFISQESFSSSPVTLTGCSGNADQVQWIPQAAVGAGMAGPNTQQLVNFKQFGRCLDVQSQVITNPLISWPCKATPAGSPLWNQRWLYNATTQTLSTNYLSNTTRFYCAQAPTVGATGSALRIYVVACPNPGTATPANLRWTRHIDTTAPYADLYTYWDNITGTGTPYAQRCLSPSATDLYQTGNGVSYVSDITCDGSLLQKWNADPRVLSRTPLKDGTEKAVNGSN